MRRRRGLAALALAVLSAGCYELEQPLGPEATAPFDPKLVGHWRCVSPNEGRDNDVLTHLSVVRAGERQYEVRLEMTGEDPARYRGHRTDVGSLALLSLQEVKSGPVSTPEGWNFVRAALPEPNVLTIDILDDDPFKDQPETVEATRKFLAANATRPELFVRFCVCARVG